MKRRAPHAQSRNAASPINSIRNRVFTGLTVTGSLGNEHALSAVRDVRASALGHRWWIAPTPCARRAEAMALRVSLHTREGCDARRARCERTIVVRITRCSGPPLAFRAVELRSGPNVWISEHRDDIDLRRGEAFGIETALRSTARAGVVIVTIERGGRAETIRRPITLR